MKIFKLYNWFLIFLSAIIFSIWPSPAVSQMMGPKVYVYQSTDCSFLTWYGALCQDTDDGKLYVWDGATQVELGAGGANITSINALTFADVSIIELTGVGGSAVVTSGGANRLLGSNADNTATEFKSSLTGITLGGFTASKGLCSNASGNAVACTNLSDTAINVEEINLPSTNADPSTTAGQIRHDSTVTGSAQGAIKFWDGSKVRQIHDDQVSAIPLLTTGIVDGTAPVVITTTSADYQLGATYKSGYIFINPTSSSASNSAILPAAAAGLQYVVGNYAGKTGTLTVKTKTGVGVQYIDLDGILTANTGYIQATAVAGNIGSFIGLSSTVWKAIPTKGVWTKGP